MPEIYAEKFYNLVRIIEEIMDKVQEEFRKEKSFYLATIIILCVLTKSFSVDMYNLSVCITKVR